jgi:hypothetical protein
MAAEMRRDISGRGKPVQLQLAGSFGGVARGRRGLVQAVM